jgi:hypothetical protein
MADLAALGPGAVPSPIAQTLDGEILDSASDLGEELRCIRPEVDPRAATDPMPWTAVATPAGFFYPKQGDRAVFTYPAGGPPVIVAWYPQASVPDVPLP